MLKRQILSSNVRRLDFSARSNNFNNASRSFHVLLNLPRFCVKIGKISPELNVRIFEGERGLKLLTNRGN